MPSPEPEACKSGIQFKKKKKKKLAKVPPEDGRVGAYGLASVTDSV